MFQMSLCLLFIHPFLHLKPPSEGTFHCYLGPNRIQTNVFSPANCSQTNATFSFLLSRSTRSLWEWTRPFTERTGALPSGRRRGFCALLALLLDLNSSLKTPQGSSPLAAMLPIPGSAPPPPPLPVAAALHSSFLNPWVFI